MQNIIINSDNYNVIKSKKCSGFRPMVRIGLHCKRDIENLCIYLNKKTMALLNENVTHCQLTSDGNTLRLDFTKGNLYVTKSKANNSVWLGRELSAAISQYFAIGRYDAKINTQGTVLEITR